MQNHCRHLAILVLTINISTTVSFGLVPLGQWSRRGGRWQSGHIS